MDAVVQALLNLSKLEITLIRISGQEKNSYLMEVESKVTNTGPISATQLPMTVDMIGPGGLFGKLDLPEVKTKSSGVDVHIPAKRIEIVDYAAFQAFVKAIQQDEKLTLTLDNGVGQVKALLMTSNIVYKKQAELAGMKGPKSVIVKTEVTGDGKFKNTLKISNPSPLEIEIVGSVFHYVDEAGTVIAVQRGNINIVRGDSYHEVVGEVLAKNPQGKLRLVGVDVEQDSWMKDTIKYFNDEITPTPELAALFA